MSRQTIEERLEELYQKNVKPVMKERLFHMWLNAETQEEREQLYSATKHGLPLLTNLLMKSIRGNNNG